MGERTRRAGRVWPAVLTAIVLLHVGGALARSQGDVDVLQGGASSVEDLRLGRFYQGGTRLRIPRLGVSFTVPHEWRASLPAGSQVIHLDSPRRAGIGIILLLPGVTPDEVAARMQEPLALEEAYVLDPTGPVERKGLRLSASYLRGNQIGRALALLGPRDQALVYMLVGPQEQAAYYEQVLTALARSTEFLGPEATDRLTAWYERLSGMSLTRTSDATEQEWHLCSDGRFLHRVQQLAGTGQDRGGFEEFGTWRVEIREEGPTLVVQARHALPRNVRLREVGDAVSLGDERFERRVSNQCF